MSIKSSRPRELGSFLLVATSCLLFGMQPGVAGEISWRVENNFRLLKKPSDQDWIKNIAIQDQHPQSASFSVDDLARRWAKVPPTYYDSRSGKYDPIYINPTEWVIRLSLPLAPYGSQCQWRVGAQSFRGSCHDFIPDMSFGKGPTSVSVAGPHGLSSSTQVEIKDVLFAVLGDSYIAGEGNPDVFQDGQKRKSQWWDRKCHRSLYAWPILAAARYAVEHPQQSVAVVSRACSGAILSDLLNVPGEEYIGPTNAELKFRPRRGSERNVQVDGSVELKPQIAQLSKDLCLDTWVDDPRAKDDPHFTGEGECTGARRSPDFVFLSIGGNDAKFAPLIINALALKINKGIELQKAGENRDSFFEGMLRPLLAVLDSEIVDYQQEAAATVNYLEEFYPKMAERLYRSFQGVPTIMALYPDPLHGEPITMCGRTSGQNLWSRDDGIQTVDFTSHGIEDVLSKMLKRRISNEEVAAIHDDFYLRFVGREPLPLQGLRGEERKARLSRNNDYRGLLSVGKAVENRYPGIWHVVPTSRYYPAPDSPRDVVPLDPAQAKMYLHKDVDQLPGFHVRGYCVSGVTGTGRWFNTISDSIDRQGSLGGAMHPNIFGQLYYVSKVYAKLDDVKVSEVSPRSRYPLVCPAQSELLKQRVRIESLYNGQSKDGVDLKGLKHIADESSRILGRDFLGPYSQAYGQYKASRHDYSGRARYAPQSPSDPARNEWGTDQWGRQPSLEYKEIAAYNHAKAVWEAKMADYEAAYIDKMDALSALDRTYMRCGHSQ